MVGCVCVSAAETRAARALQRKAALKVHPGRTGPARRPPPQVGLPVSPLPTPGRPGGSGRTHPLAGSRAGTLGRAASSPRRAAPRPPLLLPAPRRPPPLSPRGGACARVRPRRAHPEPRAAPARAPQRSRTAPRGPAAPEGRDARLPAPPPPARPPLGSQGAPGAALRAGLRAERGCRTGRRAHLLLPGPARPLLPAGTLVFSAQDPLDPVGRSRGGETADQDSVLGNPGRPRPVRVNCAASSRAVNKPFKISGVSKLREIKGKRGGQTALLAGPAVWPAVGVSPLSSWPVPGNQAPHFLFVSRKGEDPSVWSANFPLHFQSGEWRVVSWNDKDARVSLWLLKFESLLFLLP